MRINYIILNSKFLLGILFVLGHELFPQASYEIKFLRYFNSQNYLGKIKAFDTLNEDLKLRIYPLIKSDLLKIRETAIIDNKTEVIDKLVCMDADLIFINRNYSKCIPVYLDLLSKSKIKNNTDSANVLHNLKVCFIYIGALNKAIEIHKLLVKLKKENGKLNDYILDPKLSTIYYEMKSYKECLHQQLLEYNDIRGILSMELSFFNNRGLFWDHFQNQDSAIFCYEKAKKIFHQIHNNKSLSLNDEFVIGLIDGNIGQSLMKLKEFEKAIPLLKKDVWSSKRISNFHNAAISQLELSKCYLNLNKLELSKKYIDSSGIYLNSIDDVKSKLNVLFQYANYYHKTGDLNKSVKYFQNYIILKDSLTAAESIKELIATQVLYQLEEKENLIIQNKINDNQKNIEIATHTKNRNILLVIGFLLIGTIFSILFQLRKANKQKDLLEINKEVIEKKNEIISKSLHEKDFLIKEVHHRVKNNLQIVSSLLKLQSEKTTNDEVKVSLQEAHNRINAMALIHQLLYRDNEMTQLDFKTYLSNLITQISNSFVSKNKNIKIEDHLIDISLDLDTAIPLGLIANELLSNSFKHAFNGNDGIIKIELTKINELDFILKISDNGKGLKNDFDSLKTNSLGFDIVSILTDQINAKLTCYNDKGAHFEIAFKANFI